MRRRPVLNLAFICLSYIGFSSPAALAQAVPEGFEFLSEPQTAFIDLYFGGDNIGGALATFTDETVTFDDPAGIADLLPNLKDSVAVQMALSDALPTNEQQICYNEQSIDCGRLAPDIIGVIFDAGLFRADIFVNPAYLQTSTFDDAMFLPAGSDEFAVTADLSGSISGSQGDAQSETKYQATTRLIAAQGNQRLEFTGGIASDKNGDVDRLAVVRERESLRSEAGFIRSSGTALISELETYGARLQSTTDLRLDLEQTSATPIILFIERKSRVEILRDGRLLASKVYNAGNQELDIAALPDGAYDIDIRVFEGARLVNQVTHFFVKSRRFPPRDTNMYIVEAGVIARQNTIDALPAATDKFLIHTGLSRRIADNIAISADIFASEDVSSISGNMIYLTRSLNIETDALYSTDGSWATRLRVNYNVKGFSTSLDGLWAEDGDYKGKSRTGLFDPVNEDLGELIWNNHFNIGPARVGARLEHRRRRNSTTAAKGSETFILPTIDWSYQPRATQTLTASLSGRFGEGQEEVFLRLAIRQKQGKWTFGGSNRSVFKDPKNDLFESNVVEANWRDGLLFTDDVEAGIGIRQDNSAQETLFGSASYIGRRAQANLDFDLGLNGDHVTSYAGAVRSGLTYTRGSLSFAGRQQSGSAIIIDLTGDADGALLGVRVNGRDYGYAAVGSRTPIFLPSYDLYRVELVNKDGDNIRFDGKSQKTPLYPGNVVSMDWQVDRVVPLFGQLIDQDGNPIANHKITAGIAQDYSDAYGFFVIDISAQDRAIDISEKGIKTCSINLPVIDFDQDLVSLDQAVCVRP